MSDTSLISITGRNALKALGVSLLVVLLLTCLYSLMAAVLYRSEFADYGVRIFMSRVANIAFTLLIFAGGPVFLISFALLQRFKIKY
jgi:ABC-type transporter Mla maintaining outer membrane lipid asymmetry permease subunit MlaE